MKKFYTTLLVIFFAATLFGQVNLQNNSSINNVNSSLNIVTQEKGSSDLIKELEKINVYPNPTSDELTINLSNTDLKILKIELFDITGRLIKSINIEEKKIINIDFTDQRKGLYLISFYNQLGEIIQISKIQKI